VNFYLMIPLTMLGDEVGLRDKFVNCYFKSSTLLLVGNMVIYQKCHAQLF